MQHQIQQHQIQNMPDSNSVSKQDPRQAGFSLIELIVVITIIGILATAVVVNVTGHDDAARIGVVKSDMSAIVSQAGIFKLANQHWPESIEEMMNPPIGEPAFNNMPIDPWTKAPYIIEPTDRGGIRVICYGADQQEGGEGVDADIFSDQLNSQNN